MHKKTKNTHIGFRQIIGIILLSIFMLIVVTQLHTLLGSIDMLRHARPLPLLVATGCIVVTYLFATATYYFLSSTRLPYWRTFVVQLAAMFINRLVPSGIGAVGANFAYLKRQKYKTPQALTIVSINNLLGLLGHAIVVIASVSLFSTSLPPMHVPPVPRLYLLASSIIVVSGLSAIIAKRTIRLKMVELLRTVGEQLLQYTKKPQFISLALVSSIGLTVANVTALYLCILALGVHMPFVAVLLAFTFGIGAGAALPTPGGLGGVEAGIVGGLVAYSVPITLAVSAVIAYRLISYWLPLVAGGLAFIYVQRKHYLG
jgi:uncharacterized membrane protein YbhN (UPF0104 family)